MTDPRLRRAIALSNRLLRERPDAGRRDVLRAAIALAGASLLPAAAFAQAGGTRTRFVADPFALGVASGYPVPDGFTLWTRLAPLPLQADGGLLPDEAPTVRWQVAEDERFARVVAQGERRAVGENGHSVHVDVRGLRADRTYFYRFGAGDAASPVGRTRTAPAPDAAAGPLRFAIGSCQHYEQGYFHAYRHLLDDRPDLMVFLGDYIYENSWGDDHVRRHAGGEPVDLAGYRVRHAQYRTDADLQRAHAAMPWIVTLDDHEVDNDWAGAQSEHLDPSFLLRRAAAFQAYWEHMPLPAAMRPRPDGSMRLYTDLAWGRLARFFVLDDRQYRTPQACPDPVKGGGSATVDVAACPGVDAADATLLGAEQERWLLDGLASSRTRWNVIAQQTLMTAKDELAGPVRKVWTDGWDGYTRSRDAVYDAFERRGDLNPIVVGGDIHAHVVADLKRDPWDARSPVIGSEVCGTSISSQGWPQAGYDAQRADNPHLHMARSDRRGYALLTLGDDARVDIRGLESEKTRDAGIETMARFAIEHGRPGLRPA